MEIENKLVLNDTLHIEKHKALTNGTDCTGPKPDGPATGSTLDARRWPPASGCFGLLAAPGEPRDRGRPSAAAAGLWRPAFRCAGPGELPVRFVACAMDAGDVVERSLAAAARAAALRWCGCDVGRCGVPCRWWWPPVAAVVGG